MKTLKDLLSRKKKEEVNEMKEMKMMIEWDNWIRHPPMTSTLSSGETAVISSNLPELLSGSLKEEDEEEEKNEKKEGEE